MLLLLLFPALLFSEEDKKEEEKKDEPPAIGNFALPVSQQPSPLVSFGENIIDQGTVQLFLFGDAFIGNHNYLSDLLPAILYGITDELSLFFNIPFSPRNQLGTSQSSGLEDIFVQLEYAFYNEQNRCFVDQATFVFNVTFPTGSAVKVPPTGFGAPTFFVGATFNRMRAYWFIFTSYGALIPCSNHGTRFGNQLLYQLGFGRDLPSRAGTIFAWMVEIDGAYSYRNQIEGAIDPNSGGNVVYVTPSIWLSSKKLLFQLGIGYPVVQNLFGNRLKQFISLDFNIGITF